MNLDEINSPLPARKVEIKQSDTNVAPEPLMAETVNAPVNNPPPVKKAIDIKKYWPIAAIGGVIIVIILVVTKLILPGINGQPSKNITLNYWGLWEDSSIIQSVIDEYEANNPGVKINYSMNQKINYRTRLTGRLEKSNEAGSEAPDIFRIHSSWVPMFTDYLAKVPNGVTKEVGLEEDFYQTYQNDLKIGNSFIGIPLMYDQLALFYNKELLESAQKNPPRTWWGLRETAKQLTVRDETGNIKVGGVAMGTTDNVDHWSDILGLMMKQNNIDLSKRDEVNTKKLEGVLTFYTLFRSADRVWDESMAPSTTQFANGKLAFYFAPSWRIFNLEDMNKNLRFDVTAVPQLPTLEGLDPKKVESGEVEGQLTTEQWSTYWFEGVNSKSKNQEEAWKFLKYLSRRESLEKLYTAAAQTRSFGEIYPRKSMAPMMTANSKLKPFVSTADNGGSWYMSSRTFDEGINTDMSKYFGDAINSINNNVNAAVIDLLPPLQNGITQVINKYKITRMIAE